MVEWVPSVLLIVKEAAVTVPGRVRVLEHGLRGRAIRQGCLVTEVQAFCGAASGLSMERNLLRMNTRAARNSHLVDSSREQSHRKELTGG